VIDIRLVPIWSLGSGKRASDALDRLEDRFLSLVSDRGIGDALHWVPLIHADHAPTTRGDA
jgi:hypothetical protein